MHIIRDSQFIAETDRGAAAAIGNFDGVHRGHLYVIDIARKAATATGAPLGVLTFEPHPREFFAPDTEPFRLMNAASRAHRLEKLDVEKLYELPFNQALADLSAQEFASEIIHKRLGLTHVVVGEDFCFGKGRTGTASDLAEMGRTLGFDVTIAPAFGGDAGRISSTAIRQALRDGRPGDAAEMLGHWHRLEGKVIRGDQRGRELGYPTANMSIDGLFPPCFGVYAVKFDVRTGPFAGTYDGAASIGIRPMFGVNRPNCETFVFDFAGDLYGADVSVALVEFLRPEAKFDSLDALIQQMDADCATARRILADV